MSEVKKLKEIVHLIDLISTTESKLNEILNDYDSYLNQDDLSIVTKHTNYYIQQLQGTLYISARKAFDEVN